MILEDAGLECVCFYLERGAPTVGALGNDAHGIPCKEEQRCAG